MDALEQLEKIKEKLFAAISLSYHSCGGGKSSDGVFSIHFPGYNECASDWSIELYCYALGPSRKYAWSGRNLGDVIERVEKDVDYWLWEEVESAKEEGLSEEEIETIKLHGINVAKGICV